MLGPAGYVFNKWITALFNFLTLWVCLLVTFFFSWHLSQMNRKNSPDVHYTLLCPLSNTIVRHSSISYTSLIQFRASGAHPGCHWVKGQSSKETNETRPLTLTPRVSLESAVNLTGMFLEGGRKPEYLVRARGRTCKLHTERTQIGFKSGTLLLWGSANHHCPD